MKYPKLMIFFILFEMAPFAFSQETNIRALSLKEAMEIARAKSYQVLISKSQVKHARGQNLESLSGFLPRLSISENYVRTNDPVNVFGFKLKQGVFAQPDFTLSSLNNPDAFVNFTTSFQIQQPVLNLDAVFGKSAAGLAVKARKEAARRVEETILLNVRKAYYGLILTNENVRAFEKAVASARSHRDNAKAAFEQGLINQADYLGAEVRLAELKEQLITAKHQVANANDGLKFLMGLEEDNTTLVPTDSLSLPDSSFESMKQKNLSALRADLRAIRFQTKAAARNLWMKRSSWMPRLNAFGTVEWNAADAFNKGSSSWIYGAQLQWNFFEGFAKFGRSKQASAKKEEAEIQFRQANEKAKMEVRQAKRAIKEAEGRLAVSKTAVKQAAESLRITEERYKQGLEKTSDLLDKEAAYTNANVRFLKTKYDYNVAKSQLRYALGIDE